MGDLMSCRVEGLPGRCWSSTVGSALVAMEFLTDAQVAAYGRFEGVPSRADLERFFFLDDADKSLIGDRRGDHNRLGLMLQATTVRFVGLFLEDGVPGRRFWSRHASQWERLGRCPSAMLAWRMARD